MATPYELLLSGMGSDQEYRAQDPFYVGGYNLAKAQTPKPTTNAEALWIPAIQGLLSGGLMGYGKQNANETAFADYKASPVLQALSSSTENSIGPLPAQQEAMRAYSQESAPEGWTPKVGQTDLLLASIQQQAEQERTVKEIERRDALEKLLLGQGATIDPLAFQANGGNLQGAVVPLESLSDIKAKASAQEEAAKKRAGLEAEADAMGYNPKREEETDKLRKEFSALPEVKNFSQVEKSAKIITQAIADPTAVSDQELTRYSILLIEPGMAVREGEQAAIASSASIPDSWKGQLAKAMNGEAQLGPKVREGMKKLAMRSYEGHKDQYDRTFSFYKDQARSKNIDPTRISYIGESTPSEKVFSTVITKTLKDGTTIRVSRQPDGSYVEVP